jgi:LPS-assembly lipoprotein
MRFLRLFALLPALALAACGLSPLYQQGGAMTAQKGVGQVAVASIPGKAGWLMRDALETRLGQVPAGVAARYRLDVRLDDKLEGLGLLSNNTVGRERRTLRARYQLVEVSTGAVLLDATAGSDAGLDVVSSEYATVAAEQTALENLTRVVADRIVTNLALKLRGQSAAPAAQ